MVSLQPSADEIEVSLFGPGYGEAIAMHVGDGQWMLVDSCWLDRSHGIAATAKYLEGLGVADDQVRNVVASHWHDDHVGGIASLVRRYRQAEFHFPSFLSERQGSEFLSAYSGQANPDADGTTELYNAMLEVRESGRRFSPLHFRTIVSEQRFSFGSMRAVAMSPSGSAWAAAMASVQSRVIPHTVPKKAPQPATNLSSVVVHVDYGFETVLLGSDLETHENLGWKEIVNHPWTRQRNKASLYKVAHHGSPTACMPEIWGTLVAPEAECALTPFVNGRVRLPGSDDVKRIKGYTPFLRSTAPVGRQEPKGTNAERQLVSFLKSATGRGTRMGHLRYRKRMGQTSWICEMDGAAIVL